MPPEILTVSALNKSAREILERSFPLLWVTGEISNLVRAQSGHVYFSIKDENAQARCVMFRNRFQLLPWRLENGQHVEIQALVTLYEPRGEFQLNVEAVRRAGIGARYEALARLRDKLAGEGLLASERKRALPPFPRTVGIVTSPDAAALQDILTTLRRRAANIELMLFATPVQGEGAAKKIAAAIRRCADYAVEVIILARGGGSVEDLWSFNEEAVARAIAASAVPVISGVGHETDVTLADLVADLRAATPTAAAELVSATWCQFGQEISSLRQKLRRGLQTILEARMQRVDILAHRLLHPRANLQRCRQLIRHTGVQLSNGLTSRLRREAAVLAQGRLRLSKCRPAIELGTAALTLKQQRLQTAWDIRLRAEQNRLAYLAAALTQLSPQATLARGYSIVRDAQGSIIRSSQQLHAGDAVDLRFAAGAAKASIKEVS